MEGELRQQQPPGQLLCGCCLEIQPPMTSAAAFCKTCSEDGGGDAPLCGRCAMKHTLPGNFRRLANHKYELRTSPGSQLLSQIGLSAAGADFCSSHPGEMLRFFCREKSCGEALCVHCLPIHRGHSFEDIASVRGDLRAALVAKVFSTPCWSGDHAVPPSAVSSSAPTAAANATDEASLRMLIGGPPRAAAELRARLDALAVVSSCREQQRVSSLQQSLRCPSSHCRFVAKLRRRELVPPRRPQQRLTRP